MKFKKFTIFSIQLLICFIIFGFGCSQSEYIDNRKRIDRIDQLKVSKIITEFETDSIGNILDTVSIEYLKFDDDNRLRYEKNLNSQYNITWITYFDATEDMFYREGEMEDFNEVFETLTNREGVVEKAIQINKESGRVDTILMDYSREFHPNGKVRKLHITVTHNPKDSLIGFAKLVSESAFDENEFSLYQMHKMESDTLSLIVWEYSDTVLNKVINFSYGSDTTKSIYYYEGDEILTHEEWFDFNEGEYIKVKEVNHSYNDSNDLIKTIERNIETGEVKYLKYEIEAMK